VGSALGSNKDWVFSDPFAPLDLSQFWVFFDEVFCRLGLVSRGSTLSLTDLQVSWWIKSFSWPNWFHKANWPWRSRPGLWPTLDLSQFWVFFDEVFCKLDPVSRGSTLSLTDLQVSWWIKSFSWPNWFHKANWPWRSRPGLWPTLDLSQFWVFFDEVFCKLDPVSRGSTLSLTDLQVSWWIKSFSWPNWFHKANWP
jgi:hypothetical protein